MNYVNVECEYGNCCHDVFENCKCDHSVVIVAVPANVVHKLPGVVFDEWGYSSTIPVACMLQIPNSFIVR